MLDSVIVVVAVAPAFVAPVEIVPAVMVFLPTFVLLE